MRSHVQTVFFSMILTVASGSPAWAELPADFFDLPQTERLQLLDRANMERDARVTQYGGESAMLYSEGLNLLRLGEIEDGLFKVERAIVLGLPQMSIRDPLEFNDLTHRYVGVAIALTGLQRSPKFFRQLASEHPDNSWAQVTFAFNTLRIEGLTTMGKGLRLINQAFKYDPDNLFARVAKALALSYLPFGFSAAEREWQGLLDDPSVPPALTKVLLAFKRQTYLLHGHQEKPAGLPKHRPGGSFTAKLASVLRGQSLEEYESFVELRSQGQISDALTALEQVLRRELDKPAFPLLFGPYLVALGRDNERGARFFEQLAADYPTSPHALAASGFYTHIHEGGQQLLRGLQIIEDARKQAGQQPEQQFAFDLIHAMHMSSMPGKLSEALREFEEIVPQHRSQVPYAAWVVRGHADFVRRVHGLQPSAFWATYDPWKSYVEEHDERKQGCTLYLEWTFEF